MDFSIHSSFLGETVDIAKGLLGQRLSVSHKGMTVSGIITETEAYHVSEPACHCFGGKKTTRTAPMFLAGGHLYIYFIYGMYFCLNIVTEAEGVGAAVLIRGIRPDVGLDQMRLNRGGACLDRDLANGPAKLVMALGIRPEWNGRSLFEAGCPVSIESGVEVDPREIRCGTRVGISKAQTLLWRFWIS